MVSQYKKIVTLLLPILALVACSQRQDSSANSSSIQRTISAQLCGGDIAFRRGCGFASDMVVSLSGRDIYSHIGIVVHHNNEWCVAHAVPFERGSSNGYDRVECEPIASFFGTDKTSMGAIYRYNTLDSLAQMAINRYAIGEVERATPFDHKYNLADTTELYCSEYVWRAYLQAGIDLSNERRSHINLAVIAGEFILPCDISSNDSLSLIWLLEPHTSN